MTVHLVGAGPGDPELITARGLELVRSCDVLVHDGRIIGVELPKFIEAQVVETDPGVRGDTASGGTKPAKIETGAVVQVPLFIERGETIRVDTRTNAYLERVS